MSNTITGTVYSIGKTQQISDKFSKREIAITTADTYPQTILFQFSNDKCNLLDNVRVGESVTINYNLRGRIWRGNDGVEKIFNTIDGWNIVLASNAVTAPQIASQPAPQQQSFQQREQQEMTVKNQAAPIQLNDDGLPF
jgi:single-strand DNA-binding protein